MRITQSQLLHRQYLCSKAWAEKRAEALEHYGCICNRCGGWGTDVHHKTYDRAGGMELLEDLEVLCRDCHSAHHKAECFTGRSPKRDINRRAIFSALTGKMKKMVCDRFRIPSGQLFAAINYGDARIATYASRLLGIRHVYGAGITKRGAKYILHAELDNGFSFVAKRFSKLSIDKDGRVNIAHRK